MANVREQRRTMRINKIVEWVNKAQDRFIEKEKLIAMCSLEFNCSRRTALEYINTLVYAGRIKL